MQLTYLEFLNCRCCENELQEDEKSELEERRANRSLYVQDLLVSTLEPIRSALPEELLPIEDSLGTASATSADGNEAVNEKSELADDLELINLDDNDHKQF